MHVRAREVVRFIYILTCYVDFHATFIVCSRIEGEGGDIMSDENSYNPLGGANMDKIKEILNNPEIQKNINNLLENPPKLNFSQNIYNEYKENQERLRNAFIADEDCPNYALCTKINISVPSICTKGNDTRYMCSFAESRIIILLSRLLPNEE